MSSQLILWFGSCRLDCQNEQLYCDDEPLHLTPKAFAVLRYLAEHPQQLLTKDELIDAVWPGTHVSDASLAGCIREIRRALGESTRNPRYIETVHRRGYRFLLTVQEHGSTAAPVTLAPTRSLFSRSTDSATPHLIGRDIELAQLHRAAAAARNGQRQLVFITGEAGIGKTTLVDACVAQLGEVEAGRIGRGQCIEQYGAGEAYLPLLEALAQWCRSTHGEQVIEGLRQHAPSWLLQMPAFWSGSEHEDLLRRSRGNSPQRMLRELAEAVESLALSRSLMFVLEDLHWSDVSTLNWLAYMARRREPARLLIVGTYRPVDAMTRRHELRSMTQELQLRDLCLELRLDYWSVEALVTYTSERFGADVIPSGYLRQLHRRTNGNPLFVANVFDNLVRQTVLQEHDTGWTWNESLSGRASEVPDSLRQLIELQLGPLDPEDRAMLEAASVAGMEFAAASVAAGTTTSEEIAETRCDALARRGQFLRTSGVAVWPDGTTVERYTFIHPFYQEVLYAQIPAGRQRRLHVQIGMRLEAGYGAQAKEIAAELAEHFVRGRKLEQAVTYLQYASETARRRNAYDEAAQHLRTALGLLSELSETPERDARELELQTLLGPTLMVIRGYGNAEVEQAYARARELCQQMGPTPQLFPVLWGLWQFYNTRGELQVARGLGEHLLRLGEEQDDSTLQCMAHAALGATHKFIGTFKQAEVHLEHGLAMADAESRLVLAQRYGVAPQVHCLAYASQNLWYRGYPDQALSRSQEALGVAEQLGHAHSLAIAQYAAARIHQLRCEVEETARWASRLVDYATEHDIALWRAAGQLLQGWALVGQDQSVLGITTMQEGLEVYRARGSTVSHIAYLVMMAEAFERVGQIAAGLEMLAEAFEMAPDHEARYYEAEMTRLKGALLLQQAVPDDRQSELLFQQARQVAQRQGATMWELRGTFSLCRLWQQQGKLEPARRVLTQLYQAFTEGWETIDLKAAQALLHELGQEPG